MRGTTFAARSTERLASGDVKEVEFQNDKCVGRDELLMEQVHRAREVHLISTPFGGGTAPDINKVGAAGALAVKRRLHDPSKGVVCINPNVDFEGLAEDLGWTKEQQEKKWLELFTNILSFVKKKKGDGSAVHIMSYQKVPDGNEDHWESGDRALPVPWLWRSLAIWIHLVCVPICSDAMRPGACWQCAAR